MPLQANADRQFTYIYISGIQKRSRQTATSKSMGGSKTGHEAGSETWRKARSADSRKSSATHDCADFEPKRRNLFAYASGIV
ncbi:MAG TPA: hypothetical protein DC009_06005 [Porphyromonadaceae bacterium]|nr:hypothetical protein [Porphyromonadaceae bacterium]